MLTLLDMEIIEQLLEVTARAVQPVLEWGESGLAVADGLSNLLKVIYFFQPLYILLMPTIVI